MLPLHLLRPGEGILPLGDRRPNLDGEFVTAFSAAVQLDFVTDGRGNLESEFGPEEVFHYIYGILHSPEYRRRYAEFLKSDFPRVPLPGSRALFADLVCRGESLVRLHLLETAAEHSVAFPVGGDNEVVKVRYTAPGGALPGRVWINGDQYFEGVDAETWDFAVGGYRPAEKWLKDRKGRTLSADDIAHYGAIIATLAETPTVMAQIDSIINRHGGWPAAFQPHKAAPETAEVVPFRIVEPEPEERYVTCVPIVPLEAAAGGFGDPQYVDEDSGFQWVEFDSRHRLRRGMFVSKVIGQSMEPVIPDGSWCLFRSDVEGTREGKTVLVQLRDAVDPESGERYTVKRYTSEKAAVDASGGWRHTRITLRPANRGYSPIVLTPEDEGALKVIAEFLEVVL